MYISQGHKVSLDSALKIVQKCIFGTHRRLPEPLFLADLISRKMAAGEKGGATKWKKFVNGHPELLGREKWKWIKEFDQNVAGRK